MIRLYARNYGCVALAVIALFFFHPDAEDTGRFSVDRDVTRGVRFIEKFGLVQFALVRAQKISSMSSVRILLKIENSVGLSLICLLAKLSLNKGWVNSANSLVSFPIAAKSQSI